MIVLDTISKSLRTKIGAPVATIPLQVVCSFDETKSAIITPITIENLLISNTNPVTVIAVPAYDAKRKLKFLSVYNSDSVAQEVSIELVNGGTVREVSKWTLDVGFSLIYNYDSGFAVYNTEGQTGTAVAGGGGGGTPVSSITLALEFVIDGGGIAIQTGIKGDLKIPFDCVIQSAELVADRVGSIVVDVWKDDFISFPPVVGDSITGSTPPTLTNQIKVVDTTLTGWNRNIASGAWLRYNVVSASTVQIATLSLQVTKT